MERKQNSKQSGEVIKAKRARNSERGNGQVVLVRNRGELQKMERK